MWLVWCSVSEAELVEQLNDRGRTSVGGGECMVVVVVLDWRPMDSHRLGESSVATMTTIVCCDVGDSDGDGCVRRHLA